MSDSKDFVIENGVLKKYVGRGGDVVIPDGVTRIGKDAFDRCTKLRSIKIPNGVLCIDEGAFGQCENLTSVQIPDGVITIGKQAFFWCKKLTGIEIPDSVTDIGAEAFTRCMSLADDNGFVVVRGKLYDYLGAKTQVIIPDSVTIIGEGAFRNCEKIKSIEIPNGVTSIGEYAFWKCVKLTNIQIPDSIINIGKEAFSWCENLVSITIPNGVTSIGDRAFWKCRSLANIAIFNNIAVMGDMAFKGCMNLADANGFVIVCGTLYDYFGTETQIVIPDSVLSIGKQAFCYCENLTSIEIPHNVTSIGDDAFSYCKNLTSIVISDSVISIGKEAFCRCESLACIEIPDGVTSIEDRAFAGCEKLTNITIPESITSIGEGAFWECNNLTNIEIPDGVTCIGAKAFRGCARLANPNGFVVVRGMLYDCLNMDAFIKIPDNVTSIDKDAFSRCENLERIYIPNSVVNIGERQSFANSKFCRFMVNGENTVYMAINGILFTRDQACLVAYPPAKGNKDYEIPEGVTHIGKDAFYGCKRLENITIPATVTSVGEDAFKQCENLTSITISSDISMPWMELSNYPKLANINYEGTSWPFHTDCDEKESKALSKRLFFCAPNLPFGIIKEMKLGIAAIKGFVERNSKYTDAEIVGDYLKFIASQKSICLPLVYQNDCVEIIRKMVELKKITAKNVMEDYYLPAQNCQAVNCCLFLEKEFNLGAEAAQEEKKSLRDGVYFSLNGNKLLKCPCAKDEAEYRIPEGTIEICAGAFADTLPRVIYVPDSVKIIRGGAFVLNEKSSVIIYLPDSPIKVASQAFDKKGWLNDGQVDLFTYDPIVATTFVGKYWMNLVYMGDIEMIPTKAKPHLVRNFISAAVTGQIDATQPRYVNYLKYIKSHNKTYVEQAKKNEPLLRLFVSNEILTEASCNMLIETVESPELKTMLLEYQHRMFGSKPKTNELSWGRLEATAKRQEEAMARREKIKNQAGINGVVFVASGMFENFGEYNEYVGYYDVSDLKEYIEERGGFLRSAVSSKTDYLICNDPNSQSTKCIKAKELGVEIISEKTFMEMAGMNNEMS